MATSTIPNYVINNGYGYGEVYNGRITNATLRWDRINGSLVYIWAVFQVTSDIGKDVALATGFPQPAQLTRPKIHSADGTEVYINQNGSMVSSSAVTKDAWLTVSGWYRAS